jgi:hypothetical protein
MSDPDEVDSVDKSRHTENSGVGIVFVAVGVALMLTLDAWVTGLPFVVLGLSFLAPAFTPRSRRDTESSD